MAFTDNNLDVLKGALKRQGVLNGVSEDYLAPLIARLEAAEAVITHPWCELDHEDAIKLFHEWKKSCGKSRTE